MEVEWQVHDLTQTFPEGTFDLVCAQYLHSPVEVPGQRDAILRRAAGAVAPGGLLLVIGHEKHENQERHPDVHLPSTGEVLGGLDLDPQRWHVELEDVVERAVTDHDGNPVTRQDNVLRVRRLR